jgi:hypothetical protein
MGRSGRPAAKYPRPSRHARLGRRTVGSLTGWQALCMTNNDSASNTRAASHRVSGCQCARNGTTLHWPPQTPGNGIFYPNFYPNRQRGLADRSYLLVAGPSRDNQPGCATSLPSWSCGFDSHRPLQLNGVFRFAIQSTPVEGVHSSGKLSIPVFSLLNQHLRTEVW